MHPTRPIIFSVPSPIAPPPPSPSSTRTGLLYGLAAYTWWGLSALYFKQLPHVPPLVILGHRFVWSVLLLALLITVFRRWQQVREAVVNRRLFAWLTLTAVLISCNWLVFIYAIATQQLVYASLGYFINPLFTVVLGMVFLRERLTRPQLIAVALAFAGLVYLAVAQGGLPWIAISLPLTFGFYSLIRKRTPVDPLTGLFIETAFLSPIAIVYLVVAHLRPEASADGGFNTPGTIAILLLAGAVTTAPLIWFVAAAKRLPMVTLGFLQFLNPTLQFLTAVVLFGEPFVGAKLNAFVFIWIAVAVFIIDRAWRSRPRRSVG